MLGSDPERFRLTDSEADYQTNAPANIDPETLKKSEEGIVELQEVLHEDKPKVNEISLEEEAVRLDGASPDRLSQIAEELSSAGIETVEDSLTSDIEAEDEEWTETFIAEGKEALEKLLSPKKSDEPKE
jgi:predicted transcriptional regulator